MGHLVPTFIVRNGCFYVLSAQEHRVREQAGNGS
jgi:hypothetical protein